MPKQNKEMVRRMVKAINSRNEAAFVEEAFAPRVARRVGRLFAEFRSAFPDWHEEIVELVAEDGTVFLRAEDGRFVDFWALEDSMGRMRQLGLLPSRSGEP